MEKLTVAPEPAGTPRCRGRGESHMILTSEVVHAAVAEMARHARAIMRAARGAPTGWNIMAEVAVDGDGGVRWAGVRPVEPGAGSLLVHQGRGLALILGASRYMSLADVEYAIEDWRDELELAAELEYYAELEREAAEAAKADSARADREARRLLAETGEF